jgi:glutathione S-transferase
VPWDSTTATRRYNPLEKLPVLVLPDGRGVYESRFILEWLEAKHPDPPLLPPAARTDDVLAARQVEVIADGICDALVLLFWERHRPEEHQSAPWMARQRRKVDGGLRALDALAAARSGGRDWLVGDRFGLADIAAGTVLHYLDVRFPDHPWRSLHSSLVRLADRLAERPSFQATMPVPQRIADRVV